MRKIISFDDFKVSDKEQDEPDVEVGELTDLKVINKDADADVDAVSVEVEVPAEMEEAKLTDNAQGYVSTKIAKLKAEGYPDAQAAAIAYSMARKRGMDIEKNANEVVEEENEVENNMEIKNENPHFKHLKGRDELDDEHDLTKLPPNMEVKLERPLDAQYITDNIKANIEDLINDEYEIAIELRQVVRSMRAQYPNNTDISVYDVYAIVDDQDIEDEDLVQRVKNEIKTIWMGV